MSNPTSDLEQCVIATLAAAFSAPSESITGSSRLGDPPAWDSMGHMELVVTLEREFGVTFPVYALPELVSVSAIVEALRDLRVTGKASA